jgi:UTP--glucose-1-phosphate uridylyltransferase
MKNKKIINKCLFPAAGYGTRFLPASKSVPKEMLPILTKPLLQYGVEEVLSAGITNMSIVTGRGKRAIEDHFDNSYELESQLIGTANEHYLDEIKEIIDKSTFSYIRQKQMLGLGHAILTGECLIGNEPFAVVLADDLCYCSKKGVISQMLEIFNIHKCSVIAIQEVPMNKISNYGVIDGRILDKSNNTYLVTDMVEKPKAEEAPSNMAIIGRYILTPDIFEILKDLKPDKYGEIQITDAIRVQAKLGKVIAYKFDGQRFDCGSVEGYLKATNFFAQKLNIS